MAKFAPPRIFNPMLMRDQSKASPGFGYRSFWIQVKRITSSYDIHDPLKTFSVISRGMRPLTPIKDYQQSIPTGCSLDFKINRIQEGIYDLYPVSVHFLGRGVFCSCTTSLIVV